MNLIWIKRWVRSWDDPILLLLNDADKFWNNFVIILIVASNQCSNCGGIGHFRASCTQPKNPSLDYWKAAKRQFRRENGEETAKLLGKKEQNERWKNEGKTVPVSKNSDCVDTKLI